MKCLWARQILRYYSLREITFRYIIKVIYEQFLKCCSDCWSLTVVWSYQTMHKYKLYTWIINKKLKKVSLHNIFENTGFHWPVFSRIRTESRILTLYGRIRVSENPYSRIFYAKVSCYHFQILPFYHKTKNGTWKTRICS